MSMLMDLVILFVVVLFLALTFVFAARLMSVGIRERETEWPANWRAPVEEVGPQGIPREGTETEAERHRVA